MFSQRDIQHNSKKSENALANLSSVSTVTEEISKSGSYKLIFRLKSLQEIAKFPLPHHLFILELFATNPLRMSRKIPRRIIWISRIRYPAKQFSSAHPCNITFSVLKSPLFGRLRPKRCAVAENYQSLVATENLINDPQMNTHVSFSS